MKEKTATAATLKEEWADSFNDRLEGAKLSLNTGKSKFGEDAFNHLKSIGADTNPLVIWALSEASKSLGEESALLEATPKFG